MRAAIPRTSSKLPPFPKATNHTSTTPGVALDSQQERPGRKHQAEAHRHGDEEVDVAETDLAQDAGDQQQYEGPATAKDHERPKRHDKEQGLKGGPRQQAQRVDQLAKDGAIPEWSGSRRAVGPAIEVSRVDKPVGRSRRNRRCSGCPRSRTGASPHRSRSGSLGATRATRGPRSRARGRRAEQPLPRTRAEVHFQQDLLTGDTPSTRRRARSAPPTG